MYVYSLGQTFLAVFACPQQSQHAGLLFVLLPAQMMVTILMIRHFMYSIQDPVAMQQHAVPM